MSDRLLLLKLVMLRRLFAANVKLPETVRQPAPPEICVFENVAVSQKHDRRRNSQRRRPE